MKDLIAHKSTANIIPITRKIENEQLSIIGAVNRVVKYFEFDSLDQKRELLAKVIYTLNLMDIKKDDIVFELGTNKGLKAAVMAEMGARILTVSADKFNSLKQINSITLDSKDRIQILSIDQIQHITKLAPFDKILVSPGVSNIPADLYGLIALNGKLVISDNEDQPCFLQITRTADDKFDVKRKSGLNNKTASYEVFDL